MTTLPENRTTASTAAQHVTDHNALHLKYNTDFIWLSANDLSALQGTPALANQNSTVPGWALDAAATESVHTVVTFPADWNTFDVTIYWTPTTNPTADNAVFSFLMSSFDHAELLTGYATGSTQTFTAIVSDAFYLNEDILAVGASVPAGVFHAFQIARLGADAADTLNVDAALIAVKLSKAS